MLLPIPSKKPGPAPSAMPFSAAAPLQAVPAQAAPPPPEGWYENPNNAAELRWWDGATWTNATRAAGS